MAACEGPVRKSIPYVVKPNDIIAGVADWYATSMADGYDFANILVKTREGRPIQIMPNKDANGTTSARVQAAILSLYDEKLRLKEPVKDGKNISWIEADKEIGAALKKLKDSNSPVVLLTGAMASPSTDKIIQEFIGQYPNVKHVIYDAVSESATTDAMMMMYGKRALPNYDLDKAKIIVSFGADFLGDFHGGFEKQYVAGRKPETGSMSYHVQFESNMSLTGANADNRIVTKPSDQIFALVNLFNAITDSNVASKATPVDAKVKQMASELKKAGSKGVVLTGINDKNAQLVALAINKALNSEIIDVYGEGWDSNLYVIKALSKSLLRYFLSRSKSLPSLKLNLFVKPRNYLGVALDKSILSEYKYSLVMENEASYVSEKLFYALVYGCIPIYVGPNLEELGIPQNVAFKIESKSTEALDLKSLIGLNQAELELIGHNGQEFIRSKRVEEFENTHVLREMAVKIQRIIQAEGKYYVSTL